MQETMTRARFLARDNAPTSIDASYGSVSDRAALSDVIAFAVESSYLACETDESEGTLTDAASAETWARFDAASAVLAAWIERARAVRS